MSYPYRAFWLVNSKGERYDFTSALSFFYEPKNLGFSKKLDSLRLGDKVRILNEEVQFLTVEGDLLFIADDIQTEYEKYFEFVNYLKHKPLSLYYQTPNRFTPFHADIVVTKLEKSEVKHEDSILHCPISMQMLSHWMDETVSQIYDGSGQVEGKIYYIDQGHKHAYAYPGNTLHNILLRNDGTEDTGLIITILNPITNPRLSMSNADGVYGECKLVGSFDRVIINATDNVESLTLYQGGSELANPMNYQDLSVGNPENIAVTFLKLKPGDSSLSLYSEGTYSGKVMIEYTPTYATV